MIGAYLRQPTVVCATGTTSFGGRVLWDRIRFPQTNYDVLQALRSQGGYL